MLPRQTKSTETLGTASAMTGDAVLSPLKLPVNAGKPSQMPKGTSQDYWLLMKICRMISGTLVRR